MFRVARRAGSSSFRKHTIPVVHSGAIKFFAVSGTLDRFFGHYYGRRPVNATFTGVHTHDHRLPDWSIGGLELLDDEMHSLARELSTSAQNASSS